MKLLSITLITLLGILVYSNTFYASFQFDDIPYIVDNLYIRNIHHLQNIFHWWPCRFFTFISFALNYHFYQLNVFSYHLFNLTVHLAAAILVWWLVQLTFLTPAIKKEHIAKQANLISLFAALIFVSHPIQTQAVTFIWQRAASMAALFYLASLCFYIKSRLLPDVKSSPRILYYTLSLLAAILAMFTKENAITLPLTITLYEFTFLKSKEKFNWKRLSPFLFIFLTIPLTWILFNSERLQSRHSFLNDISSTQYLLTEFRVILTYVRLLFLPVHQNLDYDYPLSKSIFEISTFSSLTGLILILALAKKMFAKYRLISFSIFWFFLTLMPESSLFHFQDVIFEHRLYLPLVGYSILLTSGVYYLIGKGSIKAMTIILLLIVLSNAILTYQRNEIWSDPFTLWSDVLKKSPHKARAYNSIGLIYDKQGQNNQAFAYYNKAIELFPNYVEAYNNRGLLYYKQGNLTAALQDFNKAIQIKPDFINAYNDRGMLFSKQGLWDKAVLDFNRCISLDPDYAKAYVNRGIVYFKTRDYKNALKDAQKAQSLGDNGIVNMLSNKL